jgi:hypothetical protein
MEHSQLSKRLFVLWICFAATTAVLVPSSAARSAAQKKSASKPASVFAADKGKLKILLDGQAIGAEEFEISSSDGNWTARGTTQLTAPDGPSTRVSCTLVLAPAGAPLHYEWTAQTEKKNGAHIVFENGIARITLEMEGARPFQQDLTFNSSLIAVLDNNLYHHYAVLARVYDWSKGGSQTFPVLIPQDLTPGTIAVEATGPQSAGGKSYEVLRVSTSDLEVLLYLDANHRLMRLEVPSAKVSVVRE